MKNPNRDTSPAPKFGFVMSNSTEEQVPDDVSSARKNSTFHSVIDRRSFLTTAGAAGLSVAVSSSPARGDVKKDKIKIGQIGTGHAHASGVFSQLRQVADDYEIVGVVENDP